MRNVFIDRKVLFIVLITILICIFSLSIVYAVLSTNLTISGTSEIVASSWDIHLENPVVKSGSVSDTLPTITNGNQLSFSAKLVKPGDYYDFTVNVVNDGSIDAMIDSVVKTPELTEEQAKYLKYEITYENGKSISEKHNLAAGTSIPIRVRLVYRIDLGASDLPTTSSTLNLSLTVVYVQSDGMGIDVVNNGVSVLNANGSLDEVGTVVTIGSEQFYVIGSDDKNVNLLAMYNLYVGGSYDSSITEWTAYGSEATGLQDPNMIGLTYSTVVRYGITPFSIDSQKGTNYSDYSGSLVERYVNDYRAVIEDMGVSVIDARLITYDELTDINTFKCDYEKLSCRDSSYPWIFATSYWSGTSYDTNRIYNVGSIGDFGVDGYDSVHEAGVRPVIVISKDLF